MEKALLTPSSMFDRQNVPNDRVHHEGLHTNVLSPPGVGKWSILARSARSGLNTYATRGLYYMAAAPGHPNRRTVESGRRREAAI